MIHSRVTMLAKQLTAAVHMENDERESRALRPGAVRFDEQTIHVSATAKEAGLFVGHSERANQRTQARVVHRKNQLIADGLQEEAFVRLPLSWSRITDEQGPRGRLRFFVNEDGAESGDEAQFTQFGGAGIGQLNSTQGIRRGPGNKTRDGGNPRGARGCSALRRIFRRKLGAFACRAHSDHAAHDTQMLAYFGCGGGEHFAWRRLAVHQAVDFSDGGEVAVSFRSGWRSRWLRERRLHDGWRWWSGSDRNGRGGSRFGGGLFRRAFGPPIRTLVERAQAFIFFFLGGKKLRNALQAFDGLRLKRILEKNLDLND